MRRIFQHKLPLFFISCLFAVVLFSPLAAPVASAEGLVGAGCEFGWLGAKFNLTLCAGSVSLLVMQGTGYIAGLAGQAMDYTIENLVLDMSRFVDNTGTINNAWRILRDFSNIFFIFILLYASIATILDINGFQTKKVLVRLVVVALLINFSFFLTSVAIDVSNVLALQFHNALQIRADDGGGANTSDIFVSALKIPTFYDPAVLDNLINEHQREIGFSFMIIGIMGTLMLLVLTFVFFAAAIILLVRFGLLIIILILAPLAFMAMILPSTEKYWQMWWKTLLDQSLFAPAFFLMIYLSAVVIKSSDFLSLFNPNSSSLAQALVEGGIDNIGILLSFAIVITFLIASIIIAKKIGGQAGSIGYGWAQKAQKWTQKKVRSGIKTGSSAAVRGTVGQSARFVDDKLRETRFGTSYVGSRILNKTTKKVAGAKFGGKKSAIDTHKASLKDKKERLAKEAENDVNKVKRRERRLARKDQKLQNEVRQQEERVGRQFDTTQEGQELQALSQEVYETQAQHEQRRNEAAENELNNNPLVGEIERLERERGGWENLAANGQDEQQRQDAQRRVTQLQEMIRARRERLEQEVNEAREAAIPPEEIQQLDANIARLNQLAQQRNQVRTQASADTRKALQKVQEKLTNQVHAQRVREKWQARASGWRSRVNKRVGADTMFNQDMYADMAGKVEQVIPTTVTVRGQQTPRPAGYIVPTKFTEKTREDQLKEIMAEINREQGGGGA